MGLNDATVPNALVESCLAHQKKDHVSAAYNHARLSAPRRVLVQVWAEMFDCWTRGYTLARYLEPCGARLST